jgi:hypothetical protein
VRRILSAAVYAALLGLLGAGWFGSGGCGSQFDLPPQPEPGRIPDPGTYNLLATWAVPNPGAVAMFGLYVFVIEDSSQIGAYYANRFSPVRPSLIGQFEDLIEPVQIAVSKRDSLYVVVADRGDMHCKIYYWLGGPPLYRFTDPRWQEFSGLAADPDLRIYVSDAARDTISSYNRWGAHLRVVSEYGTGSGYVIRPHGIALATGMPGSPLLVADAGKSWVQRLRPDTTAIPVYLDPIGLESAELDSAKGVAADRYGEYAFVADTGNDRVLKYLMSGAFVDTVYSAAKIVLEPPVTAPRYLCSEDSIVFLSDPAHDRLVLLNLASD